MERLKAISRILWRIFRLPIISAAIVALLMMVVVVGENWEQIKPMEGVSIEKGLGGAIGGYIGRNFRFRIR
jgi:hypothetical protein